MSADYKVQIVDDSGQADMSITVVGDQVVSLAGASSGDVLTVQSDGTVAPDAPAAPGAPTHRTKSAATTSSRSPNPRSPG